MNYRGVIAIALIIMLGIAGLSLVGCPDNTGSGDGTGDGTDTGSDTDTGSGTDTGSDTALAVPDTTAPGQVTSAMASVAANSVTLSWTNPTDADLSHIRITWTPITSGPTQLIETARIAPVATTQIIAGLTASTPHTFTLIAVDASGNASDSSSAPTVSATTVGEFTAIGAGTSHTCALRGGTVSCWGARTNGRLGIGGATTGNQPTPVAVSGPGGMGALTDASVLSVGSLHTCVIAGDNDAAYCWGDGSRGRLGNGAIIGVQATPAAVVSGEAGDGAPLTGVFSIAAGNFHTCVIAGTERAAYCWGISSNGQLGNGATTGVQPTPVAVSGPGGRAPLTGVFSIAAGNFHTCAIAGTERAAYCWGSDFNGQLGNGATSGNQTAPVAVMGALGTTAPAFIGVTAIFAGARHACAIASGTAYCWGGGTNGRLGSNTITTQNRPTLVVAATEMRAPPVSEVDGRAPLAAVTTFGLFSNSLAPSPHSCAVAGSTNIAYCWGRGGDALGIGAGTDDQLRPVAVRGVGASGMPSGMPNGMPSGMISGIVAIAAGAVHTCAVSPAAAYCWGEDTDGQLGNGATVTASQSSPVDITSNF